MGDPQVLEGLGWPIPPRGREASEPRLWGLLALGMWNGWSEDQNLRGKGMISDRTVTEAVVERA